MPLRLGRVLADLPARWTTWSAPSSAGARRAPPRRRHGCFTAGPPAARHLNHRLKAIGIRPRAGRQAALLDLVAELSAMVVSRLLGFNQSTADHWRQEAGPLSAAYAAALSHR
ncbi:hypothetical protein [Streptomyces sp. CA-146814]|uniref:hypothetical protein n=1 Tax=Streptomyces sp. CA-146814 TaxID=3240053 RepID=UPI003D8D256F